MRSPDSSRRQFLTAGVCLGCALAVSGCEQSLEPEVPRRIELAPLDSLHEPRTIFALEKLVVFRQRDSIGVMSMNCTHQSCLLTPLENGDEGYRCNCHESSFDIQGRVLRGPATRDLPWYAAEIDGQRMLVVDLSHEVSKEWRLNVGAA